MADTVPYQIQQYQTGFAPEIAPYAQNLLGRAQAITDFTKRPFQQYMGERFAQFTPLQQQAFAGAQSMQAAPQLADASALAGTAGLRAFQAGTYGPMQYMPQSFTQQGVAQSFMNPYMQQVLNPQLQAMQRQADIQRSTLGAQAAKSGMFGGAREGLMNQQLNADLMRQQQQATGQAYGQAYGQAQQQFNQEQAAKQNAVQLMEQSRQYGAGLGLQGLQTALQAAGQLGQMGQTQFGQNMAINQLQQQYGQQQQQRMQDILGAQYQDFMNYQNYPYKQLAFMSDIIRGVPLSQTGSTIYQQAPSTMSQLAGLGTAAYGASKLFGAKKGGAIKEDKPKGLAALAIHNMGR